MNGAPRVLAIASHPIQYHAPWFRGLAASPGIDFSVLFVQIPDAQAQGRGFGIAFQWDVPLLDGYHWRTVPRLREHAPGPRAFATRVVDALPLLRELAPDVVVATGWHTWPMVQLLHAAHKLRVPVLMRCEANAMRVRPWPVRVAHRWLLGQCTAFLPIGLSNREFYRSYGVPDDRMFDAPYFIDNERFVEAAARLEPRRAELRRRWGIPGEATCFCFAGKLEPKKRVMDLLQALDIARSRSPGLHVLVVGTGELQAQAEAFAARGQLPVTFAGFLNQSEIAAAYVASDALALPSDAGETWGLVVNEAMACGRAAVVSDRVGCGPDLVQQGETGVRVPVGDVRAWADALATLSADPARLREMGRRARERVLARYGPAQAVAGTLQAIARTRPET